MNINGEITANNFETEAQFPIYRKVDAAFTEGECVIYTRVTQDMKFVEIRYSAPHNKNRETYEVTFGTTCLRPTECRDYSLGLGEYASNQAEFSKIFDELKYRLRTV